MDKTWANIQYRTSTASDEQEGWIALDLTRRVGATAERIARVTYWDAEGQFSFEMFAKEIPLVIVEELIAEAKQTIIIR
jgi:hypothetical protein